MFGNQTTDHRGRISQGHFELNVYKPVIAYCMLQSIRLLADAARSFTDTLRRSASSADETRIHELTERSLMLVTALAPQDRLRQRRARSRRPRTRTARRCVEEAVGGGYVSAAEFDALVRPGEDGADQADGCPPSCQKNL